MTKKHRLYTSLFSLILSTSLLFACASKKQQSIIEHIQNEYKNTVNLNERYIHNVYGKPDPTSFNRLKRYRSDAYQALMKLRSKYDKSKPLPKTEIKETETKINVYRSYLNVLGATSATKDNIFGF